MLKKNGLYGFMGRIGATGDIACMESSRSLFQNNALDNRKWGTREERRLAIVTWIERTFHHRWRKRSLGKMTFVDYEVVFQAIDEALVAA